MKLRVRLALGLLSGGLLLLAFPPVDQGYVAWAALVPLLIALRGATARAGALVGLVAGLAFFGGLLYWIAAFGFVAWLPLAIVQALWWALFGWLGAWASRAWFGRLAGTPLLFAAFEIARERFPLGGFAWGLVGTTQHDGGPLLPLARVGGVFLLGAAVLVVNAAIAELLTPGRVWRRALTVALAAGMVLAASSLPLGLAGPVHGRIEIASVQVNVRAFGVQRGVRTGPEDERIIDSLIGVTEERVALDPPDVVIWPENALDDDPFLNAALGDRVASAIADVGVPFLVGAILDVDETHFRNALLLYDAEGKTVGRYDKQHLVPFGEYVPWPGLRSVIPALDQVPSDGVAGSNPVVFEVGGARIGGVICFESTFPELVREVVRDGADVIVVATNNASFGRSTASAEHLAQSQIRAVEHGRMIVHSAISGISAIVEPDGKVSRRTRLFEPDVLRVTAPLTRGRTPYTRFGDAIELGIAGLGAAFGIAGFSRMLARRRHRREERAMEEFDWGPPLPDVAAAPPAPEAPPAHAAPPAPEAPPAHAAPRAPEAPPAHAAPPAPEAPPAREAPE